MRKMFEISKRALEKVGNGVTVAGDEHASCCEGLSIVYVFVDETKMTECEAPRSGGECLFALVEFDGIDSFPEEWACAEDHVIHAGCDFCFPVAVLIGLALKDALPISGEDDVALGGWRTAIWRGESTTYDRFSCCGSRLPMGCSGRKGCSE